MVYRSLSVFLSSAAAGDQPPCRCTCLAALARPSPRRQRSEPRTGKSASCRPVHKIGLAQSWAMSWRAGRQPRRSDCRRRRLSEHVHMILFRVRPIRASPISHRRGWASGVGGTPLDGWHKTRYIGCHIGGYDAESMGNVPLISVFCRIESRTLPPNPKIQEKQAIATFAKRIASAVRARPQADDGFVRGNSLLGDG